MIKTRYNGKDEQGDLKKIVPRYVFHCITSLRSRKVKRSHFLKLNEEVNRHRVALLRTSSDVDVILPHPTSFVKGAFFVLKRLFHLGVYLPS